MGRLLNIKIHHRVGTNVALAYGDKFTPAKAREVANLAKALATERCKRHSVANRIEVSVKTYKGHPIDRYVEVSVKGRNGVEIASLLEFGGWKHPRTGHLMAGMHFLRDAAEFFDEKT